MSTATNLETLFSVEPAIEGGWQRLLAAQVPALPPAFTQREDQDLPELRMDLQLVLGAHSGHRHIYRGSGWLDSWNAQFTIGICTPRLCVDPSRARAQRSLPQIAEDQHNLVRARIRILAQYASGAFSEELLPYHTLTKIQESGTAPSVMTADDCDVSEITFDCLISIRSNAWPL